MKRLHILFASLFTLFLISSCGASKKASSSKGWHYDQASDQGGFGQVVKMEDGVPDEYGEFAEKRKVEEKKVIFNGNVSLAVANPDSTNNKLEEIAKKYNGYVTELGSSKSIIRVKHLNMKIALAEVETLGKVQSKRLSGKDVTNQYLDFQIRLENAEKARNRYLVLLEKAENVTAALMVEKELERLNGTIDLLKGQMNRIDHLAEFSTITVYIKEKKKPGILGYIGLGLYHSVKWLFVRN